MSYVPSLNFAVLQKEPQLQDIIPSLIVAFESQALGNMTPGLYTEYCLLRLNEDVTVVKVLLTLMINLQYYYLSTTKICRSNC